MSSREVLEFSHRFSLVLGRGVNVAHRHLDVGVPSKFAQRSEVNPGHSHASEGRVSEIVQPERKSYLRSARGGEMSLAQPA